MKQNPFTVGIKSLGNTLAYAWRPLLGAQFTLASYLFGVAAVNAVLASGDLSHIDDVPTGVALVVNHWLGLGCWG